MHSCESLVRRAGSKTQLQRAVRCTQRDPSTGIVHHYIVNQAKNRGSWVSSDSVDLSPLINDRAKRRNVQLGKYNAIMRERAKVEAEKAKIRREAEAKRRAEEIARASAKAKADALARAKARAEAQAKAKAEAQARAAAKAEARARRKAEEKARKAEAQAKKRAKLSQQHYNQHGNMRHPNHPNGDGSSRKLGNVWHKELQLALSEHEKQTMQMLASGQLSMPRIESLRTRHFSRLKKAADGLAKIGYPPISEEQLRSSMIQCEQRAGRAVAIGRTNTFQSAPVSTTQPQSRSPPSMMQGQGMVSQNTSTPAWSAPGNTSTPTPMASSLPQGHSGGMGTPGMASYAPAQQGMPPYSPMVNGGRCMLFCFVMLSSCINESTANLFKCSRFSL